MNSSLYKENQESSILVSSDEIFSHWEELLSTKDHYLLFYKSLLRTVESFQNKEYDKFDAHTTTNCCHGMGILVRDLILSILNIDLGSVQLNCKIKIDQIENNDLFNKIEWKLNEIHPCLIQLNDLYLLTFIKKIEEGKGARTSTKLLKLISHVTTNYCNKLIHVLQKKYSNIIANRYHLLHKNEAEDFLINGIPLKVWNNYVKPDLIRTDRCGAQYVSNTYSMQVVLAYLIQAKAKVAIVNDLRTLGGGLKGRLVYLFQGDGQIGFSYLKPQSTEMLEVEDSDPIVIFSGCVYSDETSLESLSKQMSPWIHQLPGLILANDVFYPQFPLVITDSNFDSRPIKPQEKSLQRLFDSLLKIKGVSSDDPSLFCLSHIYTASMRQFLNVFHRKNEHALPLSFIPNKNYSSG